MPHISKTSTPGISEGPGTEWRGDLAGYTVSMVETTESADLTPLLAGLPDDRCPSSHWGYVSKGRIWFRSDAGEESFGTGDAFYVAPGHTAGADGGSEFVIFSPAEVMAGVEAHIQKRAAELYGGAMLKG